MKVDIIVYYGHDDPEFVYDYHAVAIEIDGEEELRYGDSYHDKGEEKAEGFADAILFLNPHAIVEWHVGNLTEEEER
jgi:hypothetical protein